MYSTDMKIAVVALAVVVVFAVFAVFAVVIRRFTTPRNDIVLSGFIMIYRNLSFFQRRKLFVGEIFLQGQFFVLFFFFFVCAVHRLSHTSAY